MDREVYELAALIARYVFAALMALIVLRAARGAWIDSRRAAKLRRLSPMTGISGELVVLEGGQRALKGMRYPVIREGSIGSSRRSDIRIRHSSVRRRHALFELTDDGLRIRSHARARLSDDTGALIREITLEDGDRLYIGDVCVLLVLSIPEGVGRGRAFPDGEPSEEQEDDIEEELTAGRGYPDGSEETGNGRAGARRRPAGGMDDEPMDPDRLFDTEDMPAPRRDRRWTR